MKKTAMLFIMISSIMGAACMDINKAVKSGDLKDVESALASGQDVNQRDAEGNTPLIIAAKHGDVEIIRILVKKGADIKAKNKDGYDALSILAGYSMADISEKTKKGSQKKSLGITTAGHLKASEYLIHQGADINTRTPDGDTPLILAAGLNKKDIVELLASKRADVNAVNNKGYSALIVAAMSGHEDSICPLIQYGATSAIKDKTGRTAIQYAEQNGHSRIVQMIQEGCVAGSAVDVKQSTDHLTKPVAKKNAKARLVEKEIEGLHDQDPVVRRESARRLGELKDSRAVAPLIEALTDEHPYVRRRAAVSLGNLHDFRAVEPLLKGLQDDDTFVQKYAAESLEKITGQSFGSDSQKWQEWWAQKIRQ
ncbi:MAG: ankyrin repeat domain-containing protein [Nitrospirota bacterium]